MCILPDSLFGRSDAPHASNRARACPQVARFCPIVPDKNNEAGLRNPAAAPSAKSAFDRAGRQWLIARSAIALGLQPWLNSSSNSAKTGTPPAPDGRLDAPAFHRNHEAIWSAIAGFLGAQTGDVLEIGSGTGQHAVAFARRTPQLTWWPSDIFPSHLASIEAWRRHAGLANLRAPQRIDLTDPAWTWTAMSRPAARSRPCCASTCCTFRPGACRKI